MKVAVLGLGSIGRRHARNLHALGTRDLVVHDPVPASLQAAAAELPNAHLAKEPEAVWATRPDVVLVATPTGSHVKLARQAVAAGAHVFIEKPLSASDTGVDDLAREAQAAGVATMVGCNMRFHPGPQQLKAWLDAGTIGPVVSARVETGSYLPNWRPGTDYRQSYSASPTEGGAVLDCIHELDLAQWLLGPAKLLHATVRPATSIDLPQTDGLAEVILAHGARTVSSVHLNFIERDYRRQCHIVGETGSLHWSWHTGTVRYGSDGQVAQRIPHDKFDVNDMYVAEMKHFLAALGDLTGAPMNGAAEAAQTLRLALAIRGARA